MKLKTRFLQAALCGLLAVGGALLPSSAKAAYVPTPSASISYSSYVRLTWSASSSATYGYVIRRSTSSSYSSSSFLARVSSQSTTTYYDYSATAGVTYYYWVCPIYWVSGSTYYHWYNASNYDWGRKAATPSVYVPTPSASISYSSYVKLTWSSSSAATYGYVIRRSTSSSYSSSSFLARVSSASTTTYYDYSATAGVQYYYWVCPIYRVSGSTYYHYYNASNYDWGRKVQSTPTVYVPTPSASITYSSYVKLTWSSSSAATYGYVIRRGTSSSYSSSSYLARVSSSSTTTYYDYSATAGVTYYYWVCPIYRVSGSTYYHYYNASNYDWGRKVQSTPTVYVPTPSASISYSSYVKLTWSTSSAATYGYVIRRSTSSSYSSSSFLKYVSSPYTTTAYDYSATTGVTYYYWVCPVYRVSGTTYYHYYNASNYDWGRKSY